MKMLFIIGMRRSGTSVLREIITSHPGVVGIEFEPHPLWHAVDLAHFKRFKNLNWVKAELQSFRTKCGGWKWYGAKFALNPGLKALEWQWLPITFPEAKFIFIGRDPGDTYRSYMKQDKNAVRGYLEADIYFKLYKQVHRSFRHHFENNPTNSTYILYEELVKNAEKEMNLVWKMIDLEPLKGINSMMHKPENWSRHEAS